MKTVFPRLSAHDLISALPRVSAYPLLHQGSYIQGFSYSGVYISVSYMTVPCTDVDIDRCSLHSGVQINVSYMTGPWPDVVIDRKILWSGVCVNRKFLHLVCILWSDVDINLTMSHPRWTRVLMFIPMVAIKIHDRKSFYLFSINVQYTQNSGQFYLITPGRNLPRMVLKNFNSSVL